MPLNFEHALDVARSPERVFAVLNDPTLTPHWLTACKNIDTLTPGASKLGTQLRCTFAYGAFSGTIDAELTEHIPNQRLSAAGSDSRFDVFVDFRMSPTGMGTWLINTIEITPKTFLAQMAAPLIQSQLPGQMVQALNSLRTLIESGNP